ncbi:MAG: ABC transporter permease [Anaerolineae bacterium]|jgi:ABC-type dipeptide/oligopeptide/nickel transport system permease component
MTTYILRRFLWLIPVILMVTMVVFGAMKMVPGGPFSTQGRPMSPEIRANFEARYHLDEPVWKQYVRYLVGDFVDTGRLAHFGRHGLLGFDFGPSYKYRGRTINDVLFDGGIVKAPVAVSAQLGMLATIIAVGVGIPLGLISALRQNTWVDYGAMFFAMLGVSIPNFVVGLMFMLTMLWLSLHDLPALPLARWGTDSFWDWLSHMILPAITLGTGGSAIVARLTRASMLEVIRQDYIRTARAKGLREQVVVLRHALKNSLIPVTTVIGPLMAAWLTGSFIIETVFAVPGIGRFFVTSIADRDYTLIMGVFLIYAVLLALMNILVDISYAFLDPRIRFD